MYNLILLNEEEKTKKEYLQMNLITNCSVFQRSINAISPVIRTDHYISFFIHKDCYPNTDPASEDYFYIVRLFISRKSSLSEWRAKENCLC